MSLENIRFRPWHSAQLDSLTHWDEINLFPIVIGEMTRDTMCVCVCIVYTGRYTCRSHAMIISMCCFARVAIVDVCAVYSVGEIAIMNIWRESLSYDCHVDLQRKVSLSTLSWQCRQSRQFESSHYTVIWYSITFAFVVVFWAYFWLAICLCLWQFFWAYFWLVFLFLCLKKVTNASVTPWNRSYPKESWDIKWTCQRRGVSGYELHRTVRDSKITNSGRRYCAGLSIFQGIIWSRLMTANKKLKSKWIELNCRQFKKGY